MNKTLQVRQSEQQLQQVERNPLRATKELTYARDSTDPDIFSQTYEKPSTYSQFLMELNKPCDLNRDSQSAP